MPFQSTHPLRGATPPCPWSRRTARISIHAPLAGCDYKYLTHDKLTDISIHAPLAGCDLNSHLIASRLCHFNPRTPCGVRQRSASTCPRRRSFQSTHPLRGATYGVGNGNYPNAISIHAPLAGCDRLRRLRDLELVNFNPRTPCGVRLPVERPSQLSILFQSTHPLRGATIVLLP